MQKVRIWFLLFVVTSIFYGASLRYGFSQDDFYFLLISRARSLQDVFNFFIPWTQQGFAFYRPLGTQLYFYLAVALAGLKQAPLYMHVFMLFIQSVNAFLAYSLISKLTKDNKLSLWVGVLYASAASHFLSLFYIAATQQLLAAFFGLLSLNLFLANKKWFSAFIFFLALLCKENAVVIPVVAFILYLLKLPKGIKLLDLIKPFLPYAILGIAYIALRLSAGIVIQSEYQPVFGPSLINTLKWYFLFGYGAPEILLNYGPAGLFINFKQYIMDFSALGLVSTVTLLSLAAYSLFNILKSLATNKPLSRKTVLLYLSWWLISIILVVWYPDHRYPHYLDIGLIPLLLLVMQTIKPKWQNLIGVLLLASSFTAISISVKTHWTVKRAEAAQRAEDRVEASSACQKHGIVFSGVGKEPQELSYVLSLANGPRVICNNPSMGVYYGDTPTSTNDYEIVQTQGLLP